jgi:hypothetical protein
MLRRMIVLAMAGLAVAVPPAFASHHSRWNSQMKNASATASRAPGGCSIAKGRWTGTLLVTCSSGHKASLTYVFSSGRKVEGTPARGVSCWGDWKHVQSTVKVTGKSLRVTVTVSGTGVLLSTVSVEYYTG